MPTLTVTKKFEFNCAHKLHDKKKSEEENKTLYGDFTNLHGHNYEMFVTVSNTEMDLENGMIINLKLLKSIIDDFIIDRFDNVYLNNDEFYKNNNRVTTGEHFIFDIWNILKPELKRFNCTLEKIKLYDTPSSYVELVR